MKVVIHHSAREILAAFYGCLESDVDTYDLVVLPDEDGEHCFSRNAFYKSILRQRCWGYYEIHKDIHLWIAKNASKVKALMLIAHELSHSRKPMHYNTIAEEAKACDAERFVEEVYSIVRKVMK
jgi:hypothetical protein